jgi:hypothetical protein
MLSKAVEAETALCLAVMPAASGAVARAVTACLIALMPCRAACTLQLERPTIVFFENLSSLTPNDVFSSGSGVQCCATGSLQCLCCVDLSASLPMSAELKRNGDSTAEQTYRSSLESTVQAAVSAVRASTGVTDTAV